MAFRQQRILRANAFPASCLMLAIWAAGRYNKVASRRRCRDLGNSQEIIYPQRCGRSLTEPPRRPKVSKIAGDLRSAVSAGSETLAERG